MERVIREPRTKDRLIVIHKEEIYKQVDRLSYKLSKAAIAEEAAGDQVASDAEDRLDGAILGRFLDESDRQIRGRLEFCLLEEDVLVADNLIDPEGKFEYKLHLPESFKPGKLQEAAKAINEYLVRSTLMKWYDSIGSQFGPKLPTEVLVLESHIVDIFRGGFVRHPAMAFIPSYRTR